MFERWIDFWFTLLKIPEFEPTWLWTICIFLTVPIQVLGFLSPFGIIGIMFYLSGDGWLSKKFPKAADYLFIVAIILLILIFVLMPDSGGNRPPPEHPYDF